MKVCMNKILFEAVETTVIPHPKIPFQDIQRHFGINPSSLTETKVYKTKLALKDYLLEITILFYKGQIIGVFIIPEGCYNVQFPVPPTEFDFLGKNSFSTFFQLIVNKEIKDPIRMIGFLPAFKHFSVTVDKLDVTNEHLLITLDQTTVLRLKRYTRFTKAQIHEAFIGELLAKEGLFPQIYAIISLSWENVIIPEHIGQKFNPLALIMENLLSTENVDIVTGNFYLQAIRSNNTDIMQEQEEQFITFLEKILHFLKKFDTILADISQLDKQVFEVFGQPEIGFHRWTRSFIPKYNRLKEIYNDLPSLTVFSNILNAMLPYINIQLIHGDCWLRQFVCSNNERFYLLDLEDSNWGHPLYDLACLTNSLEQQNDYFRMVIATELNERKWIKKLIEAINTKINAQILPEELNTFRICRTLRLIHELDYITRFQPYLDWQIKILKQRLLDWLYELSLIVPML